MARAGRKDRGLLVRKDATGKLVYSVRLYHEGRERRFGSFSTKTAARDFYEKAKQEQKIGRFFPERYQRGGYALTQEVIAQHVATTTVKNQAAEKHYGKWWTNRLEGKRLNAVTPAVLEEAQRDLLAEGLAPQTVMHYMKFLRHILNRAVRDGKLDRNPYAHITLPKVGPGATRFLSMDEEAKVLQALTPTYAPWARLAILTGLRQREQFSLRWRQVDLERGIITLPKTKAGRVQYAPLNDEASAILRCLQIEQMNKGGCGEWVFPSKNPATHIDPRNVYIRVWLPAVAEAKIDACTWHALRHTFASRLAMSGMSDRVQADLLRHSTTALVKRYAHLCPTHLKAAVETVASFGKPAPTGEQSGQRQRGDSPLPNGTVTETGTAARAIGEKVTEVLDKFGAGEGI